MIRNPSRFLCSIACFSGAIVPAVALAGEGEDEGLHAAVLIQAWGTVWDQDQDPDADPAGYGDPEHDPGVSLHRARVGFGGKHGPIDWELELGASEPYDALDFGEEAFGIEDAYVGGTIPFGIGHVRLAAGLQKVPYSREVLISSRNLLFQERAVGTQWLAPGRDLGALADLEFDFGLRVRAGAFNGGGGMFGDDNGGKLVVGRVEFNRGDSYRSWSEEGKNAVGVGFGVMSDTDLATSSLDFTADVQLRLANVNLLLEGHREVEKPRNADIAPPDVLEGTTKMGASAQLSCYAKIKDLGGLEPGVRFGWYDSATHAKDNGDVGILQVGATWRNLWGPLDLGAGYIHRFEFAGRGLPNDTIRLWVQFSEKFKVSTPHLSRGGHHREEHPAAADETGTQNPYVGKWVADGSLEGATLDLWEQPGMGTVGSFTAGKPLGKIIVGQPYPLETSVVPVDPTKPSETQLAAKLDPYGENRDIVWFELAPSVDGRLCGLGYEDGRREDAVKRTEGAGSWVCWTRK